MFTIPEKMKMLPNEQKKDSKAILQMQIPLSKDGVIDSPISKIHQRE